MSPLAPNTSASAAAWLAVLIVAGAANAESSPHAHTHRRHHAHHRFHHAHGFHHVPLGFGAYRASTAFEGVLFGKAAVIDSLGNFQVREAEAAILRQQARSLDRENDVLQTQALHTQQQLWRDAQQRERQQRQQRRDAGKLQLAQRAASVYRVAYRLDADDVNRQTGEINWPDALVSSQFATQRQRIEELVRIQMSYEEAQPSIAAELRSQVDSLIRTLQNEISSLPRDQYVAAQKFLRGLKTFAT